MYETKSISAEVKDVSLKNRTVEGYFSVFDVKDSDGDILKPGAFSRTIQENGPEGKDRIMHLWQHNPMQPLAKPSELSEDSKGLRFVSKISDTTYGTDALKLYRDEVIKEHSIGFNTIKSHWSDEQDANIITEVKLWEGSTVTWAANEFATTESLKGECGKDQLKERFDELTKAYYKGDYTDETLRIIDAQRKYLEELIYNNALDTNKEPSNPDIPQKRAAKIDDLFTQFNRKQRIRGIL